MEHGAKGIGEWPSAVDMGTYPKRSGVPASESLDLMRVGGLTL